MKKGDWIVATMHGGAVMVGGKIEEIEEISLTGCCQKVYAICFKRATYRYLIGAHTGTKTGSERCFVAEKNVKIVESEQDVESILMGELL